MKSTFYPPSRISEICRNHDHEVDNGEASVGILSQTVQLQVIDDEDACWEDCTSEEGADAEYCEGKL